MVISRNHTQAVGSAGEQVSKFQSEQVSNKKHWCYFANKKFLKHSNFGDCLGHESEELMSAKCEGSALS